MRNALLTLLLINVLAFAYQHWVLEPAVKVPADFRPQDVPELLTARRVVQPLPMDPAVVDLNGSGLGEIEPANRCLRIGPFSGRADAGQVQEALAEQALESRLTEREGEVWVGHWVQVLDQGSRAAAERARDALIRAGIPDAYILPGDEDNRISLGVYRRRSSANRVLETSVGLGYDTRVDDRYQPGTNFWIEVTLPPERTGLPAEFRTDSGQILRTEAIACPAAMP